MNHKFFIFLVTLTLFPNPAKAQKPCDKRLQKIICLVDPPLKEEDRYTANRSCLKAPEKYKKIILNTYKLYPVFIQEKICTLQKLYLEKEFFGAAWSALGNEADPNTALIGIRLKELQANPSLQRYQTWFDQQSFGSFRPF